MTPDLTAAIERAASELAIRYDFSSSSQAFVHLAAETMQAHLSPLFEAQERRIAELERIIGTRALLHDDPVVAVTMPAGDGPPVVERISDLIKRQTGDTP